MTSSSIGLARGILRNAGGLFLVGMFAKGMGLVIAVLVARFLGADAMGLFALLFSIAMLLFTRGRGITHEWRRKKLLALCADVRKRWSKAA